MAGSHFNVNRPVHLARRDVFHQRAVELLYHPTGEMNTRARVRHIKHILLLVEKAERHARFAAQSSESNPREEEFVHFLGLIRKNVQSVHAMMAHQLQLETSGSHLGAFLGTTPSDGMVPALHYQRRAEDILQGLWHVLRLAQAPYIELNRTNQDALDENQRDRYERATQSFREEVEAKYTVPTSSSKTEIQSVL